MKKYLLIAATLASSPFIAAAQNNIINSADDVVDRVDYFINTGVWLLVSLAVLFIVWHSVQFIRHAGGEDRKTYQNAIMWGIVGLAVILSIWGLVNIVRNTFTTPDAEGQLDADIGIRSLILQRKPSLPAGGSSGGSF